MIHNLTKKLSRRLNLFNNRHNKVFAIGFNKSASCSLHALFGQLGMSSYHGTKWREIEDIVLLENYQCFSDGIPRDLPKLLKLFPEARYILNVRELETWIYSRLSHIERASGAPTRNPGWDVSIESIQGWITQRNEYHLRVLSMFTDLSRDLLVVNFIRNESAATKIADFIGIRREVERPHANRDPKNSSPPDNHVELLSQAAINLGIPERELQYDIFCPHLESEKVQVAFPADTGLADTTSHESSIIYC